MNNMSITKVGKNSDYFPPCVSCHVVSWITAEDGDGEATAGGM